MIQYTFKLRLQGGIPLTEILQISGSENDAKAIILAKYPNCQILAITPKVCW